MFIIIITTAAARWQQHFPDHIFVSGSARGNSRLFSKLKFVKNTFLTIRFLKKKEFFYL
jgi:hypothetical protein